MTSGDFYTIIAMVIYFAVLLIIGFAYAKKSNTDTTTYYLGNRKVGPWFTALSAEASDMSGYLLMGLPGLAYWCGASDVGWTCIGLAIGTYLNWLFVAKRLRKYTNLTNSITVQGFYSARLGDKKNIVAGIAAVITLIFFSVYCASCFVTCGRLFNVLFGLDYGVMMAFGALIVFLYTLIGGYLSVVATDFIQGCLMFVALAVIVIGSVTWAGGVDNAAAFLRDIPGYLSMTSIAVPTVGADGLQVVQNGQPLFGAAGEYGIITIISTMSWGLGYFGMPQVLVRFMGIRSVEEITTSRRIAVVWVIVSMACAIGIGLLGRSIIPVDLLTNPDAEKIFIVLAQIMLPSFFCGLVVCGILAASMSSASSYLLITGSAVAENIYRGIFKYDATDQQVLFINRITLVVIFLVGVFIAYDENSTIFGVVSYAWAGLGASFGPLTLCSLYWRRLNAPGAIAGMLGGAAMVVIWHNFIKPLGGVFGIYELAPAFLTSLILIFVVSLITKKPDENVLREFDHYNDEVPLYEQEKQEKEATATA